MESIHLYSANRTQTVSGTNNALVHLLYITGLRRSCTWLAIHTFLTGVSAQCVISSAFSQFVVAAVVYEKSRSEKIFQRICRTFRILAVTRSLFASPRSSRLIDAHGKLLLSFFRCGLHNTTCVYSSNDKTQHKMDKFWNVSVS